MILRRRVKPRPEVVEALEVFARLHRRQALVRFAAEVTSAWPRGARSLGRNRLVALIEKHADPTSWWDDRRGRA